MIKTYNLVPEVYYKRSRDFQLLGRIYDVVFNYMKMNSNLVHTEEIDDTLVSLVCTTLGFKETHEYNTKELKALCSVFTKCLRNKGSRASVQELLNLLLNVENETSEAFVEVDLENPYLLNVFLPANIKDISLFEDVLFYILPAGMSYRIVNEAHIQKYADDTIYFESEFIGKSQEIAVKADVANALNMSQLHDSQVDPTISSLTDSTKVERGRMEDMTIVAFGENETQEEMNSDIEQIYPKEDEGE